MIFFDSISLYKWGDASRNASDQRLMLSQFCFDSYPPGFHIFLVLTHHQANDLFNIDPTHDSTF